MKYLKEQFSVGDYIKTPSGMIGKVHKIKESMHGTCKTVYFRSLKENKMHKSSDAILSLYLTEQQYKMGQHEIELYRDLLMGLGKKLKQLNDIYVQAKLANDTAKMAKVRELLSKIASQKSHLEQELRSKEEMLSEFKKQLESGFNKVTVSK